MYLHFLHSPATTLPSAVSAVHRCDRSPPQSKNNAPQQTTFEERTIHE